MLLRQASVTLGEYRYDVVSSYEVGMDAEKDDVPFVFEKRAVLTSNFGDFVKLCGEYASSGKDSPLLCHDFSL